MQRIIINDCNRLPPGIIIDDVEKCNTLFRGGEGIPVFVGDKLNPYHNKFVSQFADVTWYQGNSVDLRSADNNINNYSCNLPISNELARFDSYRINNYCNRICKVGQNLSSDGGLCYHSMINEIHDHSSAESMDLASMSSYKRYLNRLVIKIGDGNISQDATGFCLPNGENNEQCMSQFQNNSIILNKYYDVDSNVPRDSKVMLAIADQNNSYDSNAGGYHIKVTKSCTSTNGKNLYLYISPDGSKPDIYPGAAGTYHMEKPNGKFIINADNSPKSGRIYIGLSAYNTKYLDASYQNYYTVQAWKNIYPANITSTVVWIRDLILGLFYGETTISLKSEDRQAVLNLIEGGEYSSVKSFINTLRGKSNAAIRNNIEDLIEDNNKLVPVPSNLSANLNVNTYNVLRKLIKKSTSVSILDDLYTSVLYILPYVRGNIPTDSVEELKDNHFIQLSHSEFTSVTNYFSNMIDPGQYYALHDIVEAVKNETNIASNINFNNIDVNVLSKSLYKSINEDRDPLLTIRDGGIIKKYIVVLFLLKVLLQYNQC